MRQSRLKAIFLEAAALPEPGRQTMLERECAGDHALLEQARALLASDIRGEGRGDVDGGELTRRLADAIHQPERLGLTAFGEAHAPQPVRHLNSGDALGTYTITRTLGTGGSSSVYEAIRPGLDRPVALKVMHQALANDHDRWRFEHEVKALSRLDHPSVARVIDFGVAQDTRPFIVTERVGTGEGGVQAVPFARAARPLSIPDRLEMVLTLCDAVAHAHQRGVIHRDLKSANVLVATDQDGTRRPVLVDFGIARSFTPATHPASSGPSIADTIYTTPGLIIGTVGTMAPEQASGDPDAVDTRTDVWGLGVLLFESLTGELPHGVPGPGAGGMASWLSRVQEAECRRVRSLDPSIAPDLDAIVSKALSRHREGRYVSATALANDLRRYLTGEPTKARPVTVLERAWKWARRHKKTVAVGAVVLVLAGAASAATVRAMNAERREWVRAAENYELLLGRFMDEVRDLPASSEIRRMLVADTLSRLESDTERRPNDARLLAMLAKARTAKGDLASETGESEEALRLHEATLDAWTRVCTLKPSDATARLERATQLIRVMDSKPGLSPQQRLDIIHETHREYEAVVRAAADLVPAATALCWSHERLASLDTQLGRVEDAKARRLTRIALAEPLAERYPNHPDVLYNLAESYILCGYYIDRQQPERAAAIDRGIEAGERFYAQCPNDRRSVHSLARVLTMRAHDDRLAGELGRADGPSLRAVDLAQDLWKKDKNDNLARWTLQTAAGERTVIQFYRGDLQGALQSADLCLTVVAGIVAHAGDTLEVARIRDHVEGVRSQILNRIEEARRAPVHQADR